MQSVGLSKEQEQIKLFKLHELCLKEIDEEIKRLKDQNADLRLLVQEKRIKDKVKVWEMAKVKGVGK